MPVPNTVTDLVTNAVDVIQFYDKFLSVRPRPQEREKSRDFLELEIQAIFYKYTRFSRNAHVFLEIHTIF